LYIVYLLRKPMRHCPAKGMAPLSFRRFQYGRSGKRDIDVDHGILSFPERGRHRYGANASGRHGLALGQAPGGASAEDGNMQEAMRAMIFDGAGPALRVARVPVPVPGPGEVRIAVSTCGVCRTDLHILDGELAHPKAALIPGHEILGRIESCGAGVTDLAPGDQVNAALADLRAGRLAGAAVLRIARSA
jgi:hypothetical protein